MSIAVLATALSAFNACTTDGHLPGTRVLTVATAGDVVLLGLSTSHGSTGNFDLASVHGEPMTCQGTFRYSVVPRGTARFNCANGESGVVRIEAGRSLSGEGTGESTLGPVHILYGYPLEQINARMRFPGGKVLIQDERGIGLASEDQP